MADFYLNNSNLKAKNVSISYTQEQVEEYLRCRNDPVYFIKNYCKIVSLDQGLINFNLYNYQIRFINAIHKNNRVISMQPRQMGKCLSINTKVKLKQKSTNEIFECTLGEFYAWQKFRQSLPEDLQALQDQFSGESS